MLIFPASNELISKSCQGLSGFDAFADTGANYNRLIPDDSADPISGSTGLRSSLCEIRRIEMATQ